MKKNRSAQRVRAFAPHVEVSESRVLMTSKVFDLEPNNSVASAQVLPITQRELEIKGRINVAADVDVYSAVTPANSSASLKFKAEGRLPATLTVTDANGLVVGTLGTGTGVRQISLPAGQQLYFSVSGSTQARYEAELKLRTTTVPTPKPTPTPTPVPTPTPGVIVNEVELNNSPFNATPVILDSANLPTLSGTVTKNTDKYDWFALTSPGTGTLAFSVRSADGSRIVDLEVIDAATGRKLAETKPEYGRNVVGVNVTAGQNVYLKIEAESYSPQSYLIDTGFSTGSATASIAGSTSPTFTSNSGYSYNSHDLYDDHDGDGDHDDFDDDYGYRGSRTSIVRQYKRTARS